jgi:branched-chain amino acid transport system permease protein
MKSRGHVADYGRVDTFLQQLINGISQGSAYALIALGYTMVYGVLRLINFAHSDVYMFGAFMGYYIANSRTFQETMGTSLASAMVVMLLSMAISAVLGILIERFAYRPGRTKTRFTLAFWLGVLGAAFGDMLGNSFAAVLAGAAAGIAVGVIVEWLGFRPVQQDSRLVALMVLLTIVVNYTKTGKAMRAVSFNIDAAKLMGINTDRIIAVTFAVGSALAAAGGILVSLLYPKIDPQMGVMPGLKAFVAAVLGGIGNIPGAMVGGLVLGLAEVMAVWAGASTYRDAIAFVVLILILLLKPEGILGKGAVEKV